MDNMDTGHSIKRICAARSPTVVCHPSWNTSYSASKQKFFIVELKNELRKTTELKLPSSFKSVAMLPCESRCSTTQLNSKVNLKHCDSHTFNYSKCRRRTLRLGKKYAEVLDGRNDGQSQRDKLRLCVYVDDVKRLI